MAIQPPPTYESPIDEVTGGFAPIWLKWFLDLTATVIGGSGAVTGLTGDVTGSGSGSIATTIAANAVSNSKAAQMATNTIKGNNTGGTADPSDLTVAQVLTMLGVYPKTSVQRTSDATSGSATLAADSTLSITVVAGTYNLEVFLGFYEATLGTGGFQFDLNGGTASISSIMWGVDGYITAVSGSPAATSASTAQQYATVATSSSAPSWVLAKGQVIFSGGGTFKVRWAQNTISANLTTLKALSYMTLERVA